MMGFSLEHLCHHIRQQWVFTACFLTFLINIFLTFHVNDINIKKYDHVENGKIGLAVNRNAIFYPPDIKNKLTPDSMIVVEDSRIHNDYLMGNAAYPFLLFLGKNDYDKIEKAARGLITHDYSKAAYAFKLETNLYTESLPYPDAKLCEYRCDQDKLCSGFIYQHTMLNQHVLIQCHFYKTATFSKEDRCMNCMWYKKK